MDHLLFCRWISFCVRAAIPDWTSIRRPVGIDTRASRVRGRIVPFGSCTSSTVSPRGFAAARETQRQILSARDSNAFANECTNTMRRRLGEMLRLPDDVDIAFGPSGTDVEMLALALAAGGYGRPVMNILVGPGEVGSGTPLAAACRHYDQITPSGMRVGVGDPVDEALASLVRVRPVELRTASGAMMSESEIDAAVIELVLEARRARRSRRARRAWRRRSAD